MTVTQTGATSGAPAAGVDVTSGTLSCCAPAVAESFSPAWIIEPASGSSEPDQAAAGLRAHKLAGPGAGCALPGTIWMTATYTDTTVGGSAVSATNNIWENAG